MARIGYYQFCPLFGEKEKNLARVTEALDRADADVVVLPELPFTGYGFRDRDELLRLGDDPENSFIVERLTQLCSRRGFHLVTGFAERRGERCFNSALLIGPEGLVQVYRKLHLFDGEKEIFDAGDLPLAVVEARGIRIGMMVCFDWIYPEVARTLALKGADLICHPANLVLAFCQEAMKTRCIENSVFAVTANRTGLEKRPAGELRFTGLSQIVAPDGSILCRSGFDTEELRIEERDLEVARDKRILPRNDLLADRRPRFYDEICRGKIRFKGEDRKGEP